MKRCTSKIMSWTKTKAISLPRMVVPVSSCQSIRCWNRWIGSGFNFFPVSFQQSPMLTLGNSRALWTSEKEAPARTAKRRRAIHLSFLCSQSPLNSLPLEFNGEVIKRFIFLPIFCFPSFLNCGKAISLQFELAFSTFASTENENHITDSRMPHFASMMRTGINTGVLADSHAHSRARGGNFCSHGLLMSPGTTLAVIHIKTSSKSFYIPVPHISTFSMETLLVCFSFPIDPFCCKCYERQP